MLQDCLAEDLEFHFGAVISEMVRDINDLDTSECTPMSDAELNKAVYNYLVTNYEYDPEIVAQLTQLTDDDASSY